MGKLKVVKPGLSLEIGVEVVRDQGWEQGPSRWEVEQAVQRPGEAIIILNQTMLILKKGDAKPAGYGFQFQFIFPTHHQALAMWFS